MSLHVAPKTFPWPSVLSLLYPIGAMIYMPTHSPAHVAMILGVGMANLAYLLLAAAIVAGQFRAFGLAKRRDVLIAAAASFCIGLFLSNI